MDLMSDRAFGFSEGPIPWSAVTRWCDEYGITGGQREDLRYHVNKLDSAYLEHRARAAKRSSASAGGNGPKIIRPENAGNGPRRR